MSELKLASDLILASHITGVYDVNRNTILANDDFEIVSEWAKSIEALDLNGIIFHNNFSEETCNTHKSKNIHFVKVDYDKKYNPNVFRYCIYDAFLQQNAQHIKNVFFTDVSDVMTLRNPFLEKLFLDHPEALFCGDETETLDNAWMQQHGQHLRNTIPDYGDFEAKFKDCALLNCGIIGGSLATMQPFIKKLWAIHKTYNSDNKTLYTGDMGAFNYLVRTQYSGRVIHGNPVNTIFKKYEINSSCWFKHK